MTTTPKPKLKRDRPYGADTSPLSLDTLIPPSEFEVVELSTIVVTGQPRRYFDPVKQEQLVCSIREQGILEPLIVRPLQNQQYGLVAGERRYRAAMALGLKEVPVIIKDLNDEEALKVALIENLQREDLNPVDEVEAILQLLSLELGQASEEVVSLLYRMKNTRERGRTTQAIQEGHSGDSVELRDNVIPQTETGQEQEAQLDAILEPLGYQWYSFTCNRLPLIKLPEDLLQALRRGDIEYTKAKELSKVKDDTQRSALLSEATTESLSLSDIRARVKALLRPETVEVTPKVRVQQLTRLLNRKQLWERDPRAWKRIEKLLNKIQGLLDQTEEPEEENSEPVEVEAPVEGPQNA